MESWSWSRKCPFEFTVFASQTCVSSFFSLGLSRHWFFRSHETILGSKRGAWGRGAEVKPWDYIQRQRVSARRPRIGQSRNKHSWRWDERWKFKYTTEKHSEWTWCCQWTFDNQSCRATIISIWTTNWYDRTKGKLCMTCFHVTRHVILNDKNRPVN